MKTMLHTDEGSSLKIVKENLDDRLRWKTVYNRFYISSPESRSKLEPKKIGAAESSGSHESLIEYVPEFLENLLVIFIEFGPVL